MNFNKNDLMDAVNIRFFESFALTLDKEGFVPRDFLDEIEEEIFKALKKAWKKIDKEDKRYQKSLKPPSVWKRFLSKITKHFRRSPAVVSAPAEQTPAAAEPLPAEASLTEVQAHAEK